MTARPNFTVSGTAATGDVPTKQADGSVAWEAPSGGSSPFLLAQVTLTHAQILALPSTSIEIIPAPGVGKFLVPTHGLMVFKRTADYSNIASTAVMRLVLRDVTFAPDFLSELNESTKNADLSLLLANGDSSTVVLGPAASIDTTVDSNAVFASNGFEQPALNENRPLELVVLNELQGDFTAGDPANKLLVSVSYYVVDIPT